MTEPAADQPEAAGTPGNKHHHDPLHLDPHHLEPDAEVERELLEKAVGGWRGLIDSGVPTTLFVIVYVISGQQMRPSLVAALAAGVVILIWRLVRRESLQQVVSGFLAVAVSAFIASRTGRAQDYFVVGILTNVVYGLAMLVSLLVGWPAIGLLVGALQGDPTGWRAKPELRAAYRLATWIWVGLFFGRLVVELPLYWMGAVGPLGAAKVVLGWPLFLLAAFLTYRVIHPALAADREAQAAAKATQADPVAGSAPGSARPDPELEGGSAAPAPPA